MMLVTVSVAVLVLAQAEDQAPAALAPTPAAPAPAPQAQPKPAAAAPAQPVGAQPAAPEAPSEPAVVKPNTSFNNPADFRRALDKAKKLSPEEQAEALKEVTKRLPSVEEQAKRSAVLEARETPLPEVKNFISLPEADQAKYFAREFFSTLLAGDARRVVSSCGFPFQLEDRRLANPEELFGELLKNLRSKRTDLLTLYDVEVLTPAEMEKKYGKPPSRLGSLKWQGQHTWLAVANLSGHAAIAVMHSDGPRWSVVGYHD
jgi:hypothetical protein